MRLIFLGSGAFGLPTLKALTKAHEVALVVTQPDRGAGRSRRLTPTPIAAHAEQARLPLLKTTEVNAMESIATIAAADAKVFVVIAFGQKLEQSVLGKTFAINLHASLLPKFRGAAPINWAIIRGETTTGLSVISLADRMDAGDILGQVVTHIDPMETAGGLHDRLAGLGPELVLEVLQRHETNRLARQTQNDAQATHAPKLRKNDGTVRFNQPARTVQARIHGLTPWPGCTVLLQGRPIRILRAAVDECNERDGALVGTIDAEGRVACAPGCIRLLAVQPPGGRMMSWTAYRAGHAVPEGARLRPMKDHT